MVVHCIGKLYLVVITSPFSYGCHSRDENYSLLFPLPRRETKLDIIDSFLGFIRFAVFCGASYDYDG